MIHATKDVEGAGSEDASVTIPRRSPFWRLQQYGYRKLPFLISDPSRREILELLRNRDAEDHERSTPPADEVIDLRCVWAVEFYTPSQISRLLRGFEKLGWNTEDPSGPDRNPSQWIQQNREAMGGGSWFNFGTIQRSREGLYGYGRTAPLPMGVEYALARMYSLTSSITCIVIGFALDETQSRRFEHALRRERQTYTRPLKIGGYRIVDPGSQKESEVKTLRAEMSELVAGWFRSHLPGLFASGILAGAYPTCEFLTLRNATPFPPHGERDHIRDEWLRILDLDNDFRVWRAEELRGLKFAWALARHGGSPFHAAVAAREADFSEEMLRSYGGGDRSSLVYYVDQFVNGLLSRWALLGVLSGFERYLNNMRDSAAFDSGHRARPLQLLEALGSHIAQSVDISAASVELQRFAEQEGLFRHNINVFYPCNPALHGPDEIALSESLRQQTAGRAEWLHNIDRSVRDLLLQYGTALGTREDIKLQRRMALLTWVVLGLTVVIAILTAVATVVSMGPEAFSWLR